MHQAFTKNWRGDWSSLCQLFRFFIFDIPVSSAHLLSILRPRKRSLSGSPARPRGLPGGAEPARLRQPACGRATSQPRTGAPGSGRTLAILKPESAELDIMVYSSDTAALPDASIEEIEFDAAETKDLDKLAEETRKCGISWEDLKAELGL